jgi:hypothetical protein
MKGAQALVLDAFGLAPHALAVPALDAVSERLLDPLRETVEQGLLVVLVAQADRRPTEEVVADLDRAVVQPAQQGRGGRQCSNGAPRRRRAAFGRADDDLSLSDSIAEPSSSITENPEIGFQDETHPTRSMENSRLGLVKSGASAGGRLRRQTTPADATSGRHLVARSRHTG